jgi:hypothetical protein
MASDVKSPRSRAALAVGETGLAGTVAVAAGLLLEHPTAPASIMDAAAVRKFPRFRKREGFIISLLIVKKAHEECVALNEPPRLFLPTSLKANSVAGK